MKRISVLIHEDVYASTIGGIMDLFTGANWCLEQSGRPPAFKLELVSEKVKNIQLDDPTQFICYTTIEKVTQTDLIIIPGFKGDCKTILKKYNAVISWLKEMKGIGAEIASMCSGSFFLAEAGLLNGKTATCHWGVAEEMKSCYPLIKVKSDRIITDQEGIYTSGGAYSWLNLILYLVEKYAGREIAVLCSKGFQIDYQRDSQSPFIIFSGQKEHEDTAIRTAQDFIETNVQSRITVDELASMLALGRRNLERRFKKATGNSIMEYIQRVKMEAVKKSLETSRLGVNEAMDRVGYSDPKAFRVIFKKVTGLSPLQYRNRYNREFV